MTQMQYSAYARHSTGSSMASQCYNTPEEAETDLREYVARCEEQGITPIVYTEILASCAVCGGMGEHSKIQTARPHKHRYCGERCYKACTQSKLELPTVHAWAS